MFHSCTVPPSLYHFVWNIATPSEIIAPPSKIIAPAFHTSIMSGTFQLSNNTDLWCTSPDFAKSKVAKVSISHQFILSISISTRFLSLLSLSLSFIWSTFLSHFLTMPLLSHFVIMRSVHVYFSDFPKLKVVQLGWSCRHSWFFCYQYYSGQVRDS